MAELNFLNTGDYIRYPLVEGDDFSFNEGGELPRRGMSDAGFLLGLLSEFNIDTDIVYLHSIVVDVNTVTFDFRSDAVGLLEWRWLYVFDVNAPFGCTAYSDAEPILGGLPDAARGSGFLTIGTLSDIVALGVGTYTLSELCPVEPALLQSLIDSYVNTISIANDPRRCPPGCCNNSSSSGQSESSSSSPLPTGDAFIYATGLVGAVKLKEGYNVDLIMSELDNSIEINARVGGGAGEPCEDIIIDEHGFQPGNSCATCDGYVKSVNGVAAVGGKIVLNGSAGISVEGEENELVVTVDVEKLCAT